MFTSTKTVKYNCPNFTKPIHCTPKISPTILLVQIFANTIFYPKLQKENTQSGNTGRNIFFMRKWMNVDQLVKYRLMENH